MTAVGLSLVRIDGIDKVAGRAMYAGDLHLPGMAIAKVLRSPVPHARVRRIDATRALALQGVLAVLTRDNLDVAGSSFGAYVRDQEILASEKVRYVGDMVAAVAATEDGVAAEALKLIDVDYEELPAVFTIDDALKNGAPLVHDSLDNR
jgi:CO/xanthine dehydrogenase Mo-binding subunit